MAKDQDPQSKRRSMGDFQLLSFLPLFVVAAYWIKIEAVLFVISFMLPLMLAFQELIRKPAILGEITQPKAELDPLTGLVNRQNALSRLSAFLAS